MSGLKKAYTIVGVVLLVELALQFYLIAAAALAVWGAKNNAKDVYAAFQGAHHRMEACELVPHLEGGIDIFRVVLGAPDGQGRGCDQIELQGQLNQQDHADNRVGLL